MNSYFNRSCKILEQESALLDKELERKLNIAHVLNNEVNHYKSEINRINQNAKSITEVVRQVNDREVVVKEENDGEMIVKIKKDKRSEIKTDHLTKGMLVALEFGTNKISEILPDTPDAMVSMMMLEKVPDATYEMVGGLTKQIEEIKEVIELPITHPELFEACGIDEPKGVILYGPPGTGKTLLVRAVAHHTNCSFIRVSGSELVQKYIGEGARMVRELFRMARKNAPAIIFMDEIDSIGSTRTGSGGDSEVQRTMLELLNQLDGFDNDTKAGSTQAKVKIVMATNRLDSLDPALLRPGRIDKKIEFPAPDLDGREHILRIHSRKMNSARDVKLREIAETMSGANGAELRGVCMEAGLFALRENRTHVTHNDFVLAAGKIMAQEVEKISIQKLFK